MRQTGKAMRIADVYMARVEALRLSLGRLRREIRKPGDIYGDLNGMHDSFRVRLNKRDLLAEMNGPSGDPAPFEVITDNNGWRFLRALDC